MNLYIVLRNDSENQYVTYPRQSKVVKFSKRRATIAVSYGIPYPYEAVLVNEGSKQIKRRMMLVDVRNDTVVAFPRRNIIPFLKNKCDTSGVSIHWNESKMNEIEILRQTICEKNKQISTCKQEIEYLRKYISEHIFVGFN